MTTTSRERVSLREAIHELSISKPVPDAELLEEFVRRYPEHATALTEFAVEFVLDGLKHRNEDSFNETSPTTSNGVSKAMSRFNNRLYSVKKAAAAENSTAVLPVGENPFAKLDRDGVRSLARELNVNAVFLMKLRDCQIIADTVPIGFQECLAKEMDVSPDVVATHLASAARIDPRMDFKSDQKPNAAAKQTFEEAVRNSGLTAEQQELLLRF